MIAITTVTKVGRWLGIHDIYQINKVALLPVSSVPLFPLGEEDRKREAALVEKLTTLIEDSGFYFSYTFDLTNTAQRQAAQTKTVRITRSSRPRTSAPLCTLCAALPTPRYYPCDCYRAFISCKYRGADSTLIDI